MSTHPHDDKMVHALLANYAMENVQKYLQGGRRFEALPTEQVKDSWVLAFKNWCSLRSLENEFARENLESELSLRDERVPLERVMAETEALAAEVRRWRPHNPEMLKEIRNFRLDQNRPRN